MAFGVWKKSHRFPEWEGDWVRIGTKKDSPVLSADTKEKAEEDALFRRGIYEQYSYEVKEIPECPP